MRLVITTPTGAVIESDAVRSIRAEDATGVFGIMAGHADFLTVLAISVLIWHTDDGREHCAAVRGGVLRVRRGGDVEVATPEVIQRDNLGRLREQVLQEMAKSAEAEKAARTRALGLEQSAIRHLYRYIRPAERDKRERARRSSSGGES